MGACVGRESGFRNRSKSQETRDKGRIKQENEEKKAAREAAKEFCEREDIKHRYKLYDGAEPANIGSRLQKYWFRVTVLSSSQEQTSTPTNAEISAAPSPEITAASSQDHERAFLSLSPLSKSSPIDLSDATCETLNAILRKVEQHPYIQPIQVIGHVGGSKAVVIQKLHVKGSLRDIIYQDTPYKPRQKSRSISTIVSWSKKYQVQMATSLDTPRIAALGRQILEAMKFLYDSGFHSLGHIHTGNIFLAEDQEGQEVCKVAGYDMTLLGYRTALYRKIMRKNLLKHIDVIMFGHVIYEMGSGSTLADVLPTEREYTCVKDDSVSDILKFIFALNKPTIQKILKQQFFQDKAVTVQRGLDKIKVKMSSGERAILKELAQQYTVEESDWRKFFRRAPPTSTVTNNPSLVEPLLS